MIFVKLNVEGKISKYLVCVANENFFKNSFITIQLFYILLNQGKYDELNLIGSVHTGLVYCVPLGRLDM